MKNKKIWLLIIVFIFIVGVIGGKMYMDQKEAKEKQLIEWERGAAKQIKNTFADVEEIRFDKESIDKNKISGDTGVEVLIVTKETKQNLTLILPVDDSDKYLTSYVGKTPKEGKTKDRIKIIYTNGLKEELNHAD